MGGERGEGKGATMAMLRFWNAGRAAFIVRVQFA